MSDRKSIINDWGRSILKARYHGPEDRTAEDVFWRVSKVCSIPDMIDLMVDSQKEGVPSDFQEMFGEYSYLAERAVRRRKLQKSDHRMSESMPPEFDFTERWENEALKYYNEIKDLNFMPASPTLLNAGRNDMLSSCFFFRLEDSLEHILQIVKDVGMVMKMGGGVGLDFSKVRPKGSLVSSSNGTSTGPISYMKIFNSIGDQVNQAGIRKSAMLAALSIDHPDILDFITCKSTEGDLENFNISVLITDEFMDAVESDSIFKLKHPKSEGKSVKARQIWDALVECAHSNGEPGLIFADEVNRFDALKGKYGKLGPNPCSELMLLDSENCSLAAINLANCLTDKSVDTRKLESLVRLGVRFLDNLIDLNTYPLPKIEEAALNFRKIGLGFTGLHDALLKLELPYDVKDEDTKTTLNTLFSGIKGWAFDESNRLAKSRGVPKLLFESGITDRRNSGLLTCQPAGTISLICNQVSSGIEPVFQWKYSRKDTYGTHEVKHFLLEKFKEGKLPAYAKTALELSPEDHVGVQALIQKYVCASISKTINMPSTTTVADVENTIKKAYESKCKSMTVYRSGSRKKEVLSKKSKSESDLQETREKNPLRERPRFLMGVTFKKNTPGGKAYVTINEDKEGLREVFIHISKAGSEIGSHVESEGRLISYALKHRNPIKGLINHLKGQKSTPIWEYGQSVKSVPDAVAQAMEEYMERFEGFSEFIEDHIELDDDKKEESARPEISGEFCQQCGEQLYMESGCDVCKSCGFSTCG